MFHVYNTIFLLLYTLQLKKLSIELSYDPAVALLGIYPKDTKHIQSLTASPAAPGASVLVETRLLFLDDGNRLPMSILLSALSSLRKEAFQMEVGAHHFSAQKPSMIPYLTQSPSQVPTTPGSQLLP